MMFNSVFLNVFDHRNSSHPKTHIKPSLHFGKFHFRLISHSPDLLIPMSLFQSEVKVKSVSRVRLFATPWTVEPGRIFLASLPLAWDFPGKNTGVGCHFHLQGIFPIQGSNPGLLHCRQTLSCLSHQGSPSVLSFGEVTSISPS